MPKSVIVTYALGKFSERLGSQIKKFQKEEDDRLPAIIDRVQELKDEIDQIIARGTFYN